MWIYICMIQNSQWYKKVYTQQQVHNFSGTHWSAEVARQSTGPKKIKEKTGAFRETQDKNSGLPGQGTAGHQEGVICPSLANQLGLLEKMVEHECAWQVVKALGTANTGRSASWGLIENFGQFLRKSPLWYRTGGKQ